MLGSASPVIASTSSRSYLAAMAAMLLRILTLFAVVLMPVGMAPLMAAPHHAAQSSAPGHCDEEGAAPESTGGQIDCTVACAAVAPTQLGQALTPLIPPIQLWATAPLETAGLDPEAIPPPPKRIRDRSKLES